MRRLATIGLAAFTAVLLTVEAQAACKEGFCVSGRDVNGTHVVDFTTSWRNISHFNMNSSYDGGASGKQRELGANESEFTLYELHPGDVVHFSLQACSGGGVFSSSTCTPWANFTHTVQ